MSTIQNRIQEIQDTCKELGYSQETIQCCTKSADEQKLHAIVWALRDKLPEAWIQLLANSEMSYEDMMIALHAYHSEEIPNILVRISVEHNDMQAVRKTLDALRRKRDSFMEDLINNDLFRNEKVYALLLTNDTIYLRHTFNWHTYEHCLVLVGQDSKVTFPMSSLPLIGGCWSNFVAERMLHGQMQLKFIFNVAEASLKFITSFYDIQCNIVVCDNCFYAPFLFLHRDTITGSVKITEDSTKEKVHMEYLIKEYPEAYDWLVKNPKGNFYDEFYTQHCPKT